MTGTSRFTHRAIVISCIYCYSPCRGQNKMIHGSVKTIPRSSFFELRFPVFASQIRRNYLFLFGRDKESLDIWIAPRNKTKKKFAKVKSSPPNSLPHIRRLQIFHRCSAFLSRRGENESEMGTNLDRTLLVCLFNNRTAEKLIDSKMPRAYWLEAAINGWDVVTFTATLSLFQQR